MKIEKGIELLMAACKSVLQDDRLGWMMGRAIAASEQGDVDSAIECAKRAASINPTHPDPMIMLGLLVLQEKSQRVPAVGYFRQAISHDANNALGLWYLACNELRGGRMPEALALLSAAVECEPVDSYAIVTLAWLLQQMGQSADAVSHIQNRLRNHQPELICPALAWLILCYANFPQQEPSGDNLNKKCLRDLHSTCSFDVNHKKVFEAIAAKSQKSKLRLEDLIIGSECQLLVNPALESYQPRFGECLIAGYKRSFFDLILGPEIESVIRRNNLRPSQTAPKSKEISPDMVLVPAGEYTIGCNVPALKHPYKKCYIRGFLIDRYPVTNKQWQEFDPNYTFPKGFENHPVTNVDFVQATMYARWSSKRLPTETEWEAAARGTEGYRFPWGEFPDTSRVNCGDNKPKTTTPVTQYPQGASHCGALDMLGNVQEWVDEWSPTASGRIGARIAKGGGSAVRMTDLACWLRTYLPVISKNPHIGFRCAMDL